jgi:hypothetical protein
MGSVGVGVMVRVIFAAVDPVGVNMGDVALGKGVGSLLSSAQALNTNESTNKRNIFFITSLHENKNSLSKKRP